MTDVLDGATALMVYSYNGVGSVVGTDYPEPNVMSMQFSSTWNDFPDLDRWGRVVTSKWTKDLATDKDFYKVDLAWDYNSNITSAEDQVHVGFDVKYAMDNVDRLTDADEGTLSGGSITSRTRRQEWDLSHTGNWNEDKVDLNGDGDWGDTDEVDDCRTHNVVNELTARNTNCSGGNEYTLAYDPAGNMTDDGEDYEYKWDAFYRLREVRRTDNQALVAEYKYNGLGYRIAVHEDSDTDGDVDANDKWYYDAFDERWRQVARFRESDTSPKEEFVHHCAGNDGLGTASYIDLVVCRDKDANTAWTSASDGSLEERVYYCQNQHADVSAIVSSGGAIREWASYSGYGVPFGKPGGDTNSDGDCDSADATQIQAWIDLPAYDVRGDLDLDGDVDASDKSMAQGAPFSGLVAGFGVLSALATNKRGQSGANQAIDGTTLSRVRYMTSRLGRWSARDPIGYIDSASLYSFGSSRPVTQLDPLGLFTTTDLPPVTGLPLADMCEAGGCSYLADPPVNVYINGQLMSWSLQGAIVGEADGEASGGCTSGSCHWNVKVRMQPRYLSGGQWREVRCNRSLEQQYLYFYWHGTFDCQGTNKANPAPTWTGPGTSGQNGTSILGTGTFTTPSVSCTGWHDVASWTATSPTGTTVGGRLRCYCGCGSPSTVGGGN